jgi:membrane protein required for colicin V production
MQTYDLVMLAVLLGATLFGAWKGLAWQLASMASIFVSYLVAVQFRDALAPAIKATPPWNVFLAMLILYVGTSLVIWILFRFVSAFIDRVKLKEFDRQFGALFGLAKGVLLCVIITLFAVTLLSDSQKHRIINSYSGYYIARILDKANGVMPEELHEVLSPYMNRLDQELVPEAGLAPRTATYEEHRARHESPAYEASMREPYPRHEMPGEESAERSGIFPFR